MRRRRRQRPGRFPRPVPPAQNRRRLARADRGGWTDRDEAARHRRPGDVPPHPRHLLAEDLLKHGRRLAVERGLGPEDLLGALVTALVVLAKAGGASLGSLRARVRRVWRATVWRPPGGAS